uniref:Uncharacterized protein n=1 Tax=Anopheles maculatus TaxID=74869 RepID=A0A182T5S9_9DIPT
MMVMMFWRPDLRDLFPCATSGIEFSNFHKQDVLFGLTTYESYLELTAADLEFGFNETKRDRILRTFVRNTYRYHLNEIYSALKVRQTSGGGVLAAASVRVCLRFDRNPSHTETTVKVKA